MRRSFLTASIALLALLLLAPLASAAWVWPLDGEVITPYRNGDDAYAGRQHRGIDIAGDVGTPVVAAVAGAVRFAGAVGSSGLTVGVRSGDGRFDVSYLHLSSLAVRAGQSVAAGDRIGLVGATGTPSDRRPHLHFGVRAAGSRHAYHDPLAFLPPRASPTPESPPSAPLPDPAPAPRAPVVAPAPQPIRVPAGRRTPHRIPAGRRPPQPAPADRRAPHRIPAGHRGPADRTVPHRIPAGHPAPADRRTPYRVRAGHPSPQPAPVGWPSSAADAAPHTAPAERQGEGRPGLFPAASNDGGASVHDSAGAPRGAASTPAGSASAAGTPHAPPRGSEGADSAGDGGPDIGLVLACVGLLLAAALLGLTENGRDETRRRSMQLTTLLRPLLGRR